MDGNKKSFNIRTDLAIEAQEMLHAEEKKEIEGIKVTVEESSNENISITSVEVLNDDGALQMGKPIGTYITIESQLIKENDVDCHEEVSKIMAQKLSKLIKLDRHATVLIVGLGNWNVTPDAVGPKVISKVLVTKHITGTTEFPTQIKDKVRPVCAISPGVMGITGIETGEIVKGIADRVKPDLIIAIDALAARQTNRINTTIQMSNTGITPGSGVGNKRMAINEENLGAPVIAIGIPTVVDAATLVNDTMDHMLEAMISEVEIGSEFYTMLKNLSAEEKYSLIYEILDPYVGNMFVTPKEVDAVVERISKIIANSINMFLHPGIGENDVNRYLNA